MCAAKTMEAYFHSVKKIKAQQEVILDLKSEILVKNGVLGFFITEDFM